MNVQLGGMSKSASEAILLSLFGFVTTCMCCAFCWLFCKFQETQRKLNQFEDADGMQQDRNTEVMFGGVRGNDAETPKEVSDISATPPRTPNGAPPKDTVFKQ